MCAQPTLCRLVQDVDSSDQPPGILYTFIMTLTDGHAGGFKVAGAAARFEYETRAGSAGLFTARLNHWAEQSGDAQIVEGSLKIVLLFGVVDVE